MSRVLPSASGGPAQYRVHRARVLRTTAACIAALVVIGAAPARTAHADEYSDRDQVNTQIDQANQKLDEENQTLSDAVSKAKATKDALTTAQGVLATAQKERADAQAADTAAALALKTAQDELAKAKADVEQGKKNLELERQTAGNIAMNAYRSQGQLANWAAVAASKNTSQLADRLQWTNEMMAKHNKAMDDLTRAQRAYEATETAKTTAEEKASTARTTAANTLATKQKAEKSADDAATKLAAASQADDAAQATAQRAVDDEKARLADLDTQRAAVEQRIQDRLAREAAAKKAAEEEAARQAAAAAAAAAAANAPAPAPAPAAAAPAARNSSSPFIWPVNGELTSPFGMRLHPVLGYWVLHDGQDFGAACGTPIRAAAAGTVVENYWDTTGFGNRLLVDHGYIGNTAYTTGYNHAEYYIVSVGQHVDQGQVLGYVGTTGYSTGCHLHLNLWVNGKLVDPMPYLP